MRIFSDQWTVDNGFAHPLAMRAVLPGFLVLPVLLARAILQLLSRRSNEK